jgi:hypothetical protein
VQVAEPHVVRVNEDDVGALRIRGKGERRRRQALQKESAMHGPQSISSETVLSTHRQFGKAQTCPVFSHLERQRVEDAIVTEAGRFRNASGGQRRSKGRSEFLRSGRRGFFRNLANDFPVLMSLL